MPLPLYCLWLFLLLSENLRDVGDSIWFHNLSGCHRCYMYWPGRGSMVSHQASDTSTVNSNWFVQLHSLAAFASWFCRYRTLSGEEASPATSSIFVQLQSRLAKEPQQKLPTIHDLDIYIPITTYKMWKGGQVQERCCIDTSSTLLLPLLMCPIEVAVLDPWLWARRTT